MLDAFYQTTSPAQVKCIPTLGKNDNPRARARIQCNKHPVRPSCHVTDMKRISPRPGEAFSSIPSTADLDSLNGPGTSVSASPTSTSASTRLKSSDYDELTIGSENSALDEGTLGDVVYVNPHKRKRTTSHPLNGQDCHRFDENQPSKNTETALNFEEVFQDGGAPIKHIIVQFPAGDGSWYILRCDKHGRNFKNHPIKDAGAHLGSRKHGQLSREPSVAIEYLGIEVLGCNKTLAEKNNSVALKAFQSRPKDPIASAADCRLKVGHIPPSSKGRLAWQTGRSRDRANENVQTSDGSRRQLKYFEAITEPIPGEIYLAYWQKSKDWSPVLLLPHCHLDNVGVPDTVESLGLTVDVPACYVYNHSTKEFSWREGYEDGGLLVTKREFPVMYFDGLKFPEKSAVGWVAAEDLKAFDVNGSNSSLVPHSKSARSFLRKRAEAEAEAGVASLSEGLKNRSSQKIPFSRSLLGCGSPANSSLNDLDASPIWPPTNPILSEGPDSSLQGVQEATKSSENHQKLSMKDPFDKCEVISKPMSTMEEHIDVSSCCQHKNDHRITPSDQKSFTEVIRTSVNTEDQCFPARQSQVVNSAVPAAAALDSLELGATRPQERPSETVGECGALPAENSLQNTEPISVAKPALPGYFMLNPVSTRLPLERRPKLPALCNLPEPPKETCRLPPINSFYGQRLLPTKPPSQVSTVVISLGQEHPLPRNVHTSFSRSRSSQAPVSASIPAYSRPGVAQPGNPAIKTQKGSSATAQANLQVSNQTKNPRFGIWPYTVPRHILQQLVQLSNSIDGNPRLDRFKNSRGMYFCPLCQGRAREYVHEDPFLNHLEKWH